MNNNNMQQRFLTDIFFHVKIHPEYWPTSVAEKTTFLSGEKQVIDSRQQLVDTIVTELTRKDEITISTENLSTGELRKIFSVVFRQHQDVWFRELSSNTALFRLFRRRPPDLRLVREDETA